MRRGLRQVVRRVWFQHLLNSGSSIRSEGEEGYSKATPNQAAGNAKFVKPRRVLTSPMPGQSKLDLT